LTEKKLITILASDPGASNALLPVVDVLLKNPAVELNLMAYGWALENWRQQGGEVLGLDFGISEEAAQQILQENGRPALLLCGTSHKRKSLEQCMIRAARSAGIRSLALLDFWSNYSGRFSDETGKFSALPDKIAIMDKLAYREMTQLGIKADRLVITGQPAFDALVDMQAKTSPYLTGAIRAGLEIQPEEIYILFVSQPMGDYYETNPTRPEYLGYDEKSVLTSLIQVLDEVVGRVKKPIRLVIHPHPRENYEWMQVLQAKGVRINILSGGEARYLALAANLVVGMNSTLLVEACYLGCPVVSLQPGLRLDDPLPTNRAGYSRGVFKNSDIRPVVEDLLFDEKTQKKIQAKLKKFRPDGGAALRVANLVLQMCGLQT
jgi:hypothetical protein